MYEYLRGKLVYADSFKAILDVMGIGYSLLIPVRSELPAVGQEITLYTSFVVREDEHRLYGFTTKSERDLFEKITEISGIGPKTSLSLIGHMTPSAFKIAISQANIAVLSKVPGIGKKTAERIIVELKDRIHLLIFDEKITTNKEKIAIDATCALMNLGYPSLTAQKAVQLALIDEDMDLSTLIGRALQKV